jgi:hypothetical protein
MTLRAACARAKVSHTAVKQWMLKGSGEMACPDARPYEQFVTYLDAARAELQETCLDTIHQLRRGGTVITQTVITKPDGTQTVRETRAQPSLPAATWLMEAKFGRNFGAKQRVEHSGTIRQESVNLNLNAPVSPDHARLLGAMLGSMFGVAQSQQSQEQQLLVHEETPAEIPPAGV